MSITNCLPCSMHIKNNVQLMNEDTNSWKNECRNGKDQSWFGGNHTFLSGFSSYDPFPKSFLSFMEIIHNFFFFFYPMILYLLLVEQWSLTTDIYWELTIMLPTIQITSLALSYIIILWDRWFYYPHLQMRRLKLKEFK